MADLSVLLGGGEDAAGSHSGGVEDRAGVGEVGSLSIFSDLRRFVMQRLWLPATAPPWEQTPHWCVFVS